MSPPDSFPDGGPAGAAHACMHATRSRIQLPSRILTCRQASMHFTFKFQLAMVMKHKRDDALILLHELACMQKVTAGDASAKLLPACFAAAAQMRRRHLNRRCQTVKLPKGWIRARESIRCKRTHTKKRYTMQRVIFRLPTCTLFGGVAWQCGASGGGGRAGLLGGASIALGVRLKLKGKGNGHGNGPHESRSLAWSGRGPVPIRIDHASRRGHCTHSLDRLLCPSRRVDRPHPGRAGAALPVDHQCPQPKGARVVAYVVRRRPSVRPLACRLVFANER
jgi:hypothetical protein